MDPSDLVEIHAIERLKYRYLRCVDLKLWDDIAGCFTDDATASYGGGTVELKGREAIVEYLRSSLGSTDFLTSHKAHNPEIDLTGAREARAVWALDDVVIAKAFDITVRGAAYYDDRYVKVGDDWLISHTGYRRVYEEVQPRSGAGAPSLTADWWDTDGRSSLNG
ncbi:MAG TPA: nuclear transport factor 2 family protein [Acidimicrobiales bacterium]|nr:nuclear transport factor 2 family protein [Acidimicrobiales bacterium]